MHVETANANGRIAYQCLAVHVGFMGNQNLSDFNMSAMGCYMQCTQVVLEIKLQIASEVIITS